MLAFLPSAALAEPLVVTADRWEGDAAHVHAEGSVEVHFGREVITGASADVDLGARTLTVTDGAWAHPGVGIVAFARAEIAWDEGWNASAEDARFTGTAGGRPLVVDGERMRWSSDGTLEGDRVVVAPCDCRHPPLSVQAREVRVRIGDRATFSGGWIRVFDLPLVPVPVGELPLARKSGVLPPTLGYGDDGVRASLPLYLTLGPSADSTFTPELRTARGERLLAEGRYALVSGGGAAEGAVGWDQQTDSTRWAADVSHKAAGPVGAAAVDAQLLGDPEYLADYSDLFLARATPWIESRGLVSQGFGQAWVDAFEFEPYATDRTGAALALPAARLPGGLVADIEAASLAGAQGDALAPGAWAGAAGVLTRTTWLGPLRLIPDVRGGLSGAADYPGALNGAWGEGRLEAGVPAWRDVGRGRETLEPLVTVTAGSGRITDPDGSSLLLGGRGPPPWSDEVPPWSVAPELRWRKNGRIELRAGSSTTPTGTATAASGTVGAGPWHLFAQAAQEQIAFAAPDLAYGGATWSREGWTVGAIGLYATPAELTSPLSATALSLGFPLPSSVRWFATALFDPANAEWKSALLDVRWTHPARCLSVDAQLRAAVDQPLPAVKLSFDWQPPPAPEH